jgi:hypothetical protein|tara:strand:+ start:1951 stop:2283 length:333 start_codon:yes stop_codon:yes gene_type:complete
MKTTLTEGRYAGNLEYIGKLLLEGGYQAFADWMIEQDETRQIDVVYMMSLFAKETQRLVAREDQTPPPSKNLKLRSPGLKGVNEAANDIKNKPKLTLVTNKVVPIRPKNK